ncbi:hypothetical protein ACI784_22135 [Geodermatophilus sp. SYSU D01186]
MTTPRLPGTVPDARSPIVTTQDLLTEAWRPGTAEPVAIHVRPEVLARFRAHTAVDRSSAAWGDDSRSPAARISLVVDDDIPAAPGYEIHRASPHATRRSA